MVSLPAEGHLGAELGGRVEMSNLGAAGSLAGSRHRLLGKLSGAALLAASATTRLGIFHAGLASAATRSTR